MKSITPKKLDELSNSIFKDLIIQTNKDHKEHGTVLCLNGEITTSEPCTGTECEIKGMNKLKCNNKKLFGTFHTHPSGTNLMSKNDIMSNIEKGSEIECIGTSKNNTGIIKCWKRPFGITNDISKMSLESTNNLDNLIKKHNISNELVEKSFKSGTYIEHPNPEVFSELRVATNRFIRSRHYLEDEAIIEDRMSKIHTRKGFYEQKIML